MRRLCLKPGCPDEPIYRGHCQRHARTKEQGTNRVGLPIYNTKRWKMLRKRVLFEQPLCKCGEIATDVDHIKPLAEDGPPFSRANVQGLCARCHGQKTKAETYGVGWPD